MEKKKLKWWQIALIVLGVIFILTAIFGKTEKKTDTKKEIVVSQSKSIQEVVSSTVLEETSKIGDYEVKVLEHRIVKDYENKPCIVIKYEFINNSKDATSFLLSIKDTVFQNGLECESAYFIDNFDTGQYQKEIKPNVPYEFEKAYTLIDENSPVEVELDLLISFNDKEKKTVIIELE